MDINQTHNGSDHQTTTWFNVRGYIAVIITIGIIVSNTINLIVWTRTKRLPNVTRLFLINLSSADLLVGVVATGSAIYPAFTGHWPFGDIWCQISGVVHGTSVTLSIWSIAMVGIDRCVAVLKPHNYKQLMSRTRSLTIVACLWLASGITFVMPLFSKSNFVYYQYSQSEAFCGLYWESPVYCIVTGLYIPIASAFVLLFTSLKIYQNIYVNRRGSANMPPADMASTSLPAINKRTLVILIATSACYFLFWGPYVILTILNHIIPTMHLPDVVKFSMMWIANANSMVNVFIYSLTNRSFLRQANELFRLNTPNQLRVISAGSETQTKRNYLQVNPNEETRV